MSREHTISAPGLAAVIGFLIIVGSGMSGERLPDNPSTQFAIQADQITESLDAIEREFDGTESDDLAIAWGDLKSDLESISDDLQRDARLVEIEPLMNRIENFRDRFHRDDAVRAAEEEWKAMSASLSEVLDETNQKRIADDHPTPYLLRYQSSDFSP